MKSFLLVSFIIIIRIQTVYGYFLEDFEIIDSLKKNSGIEILYNSLFQDDKKPSYEAFFYSMKGYYKLISEKKLANTKVLTIIDFSQPSNNRRLWVIDIDNQIILYNSLVAHGINTGEVYAKNFSNKQFSNMSSLGCFITGESYFGKHGYSLRLDGYEPGINDNVRKRAVVIHGANYVTMDFIKIYGRLGRSFGCPALPPQKSKIVIDTIKNKSCLFIYADDRDYIQRSKILN